MVGGYRSELRHGVARRANELPGPAPKVAQSRQTCQLSPRRSRSERVSTRGTHMADSPPVVLSRGIGEFGRWGVVAIRARMSVAGTLLASLGSLLTTTTLMGAHGRSCVRGAHLHDRQQPPPPFLPTNWASETTHRPAGARHGSEKTGAPVSRCSWRLRRLTTTTYRQRLRGGACFCAHLSISYEKTRGGIT